MYQTLWEYWGYKYMNNTLLVCSCHQVVYHLMEETYRHIFTIYGNLSQYICTHSLKPRSPPWVILLPYLIPLPFSQSPSVVHLSPKYLSNPFIFFPLPPPFTFTPVQLPVISYLGLLTSLIIGLRTFAFIPLQLIWQLASPVYSFFLRFTSRMTC